MAIYLDSANLTDAEQVKDLRWVYSITTNPTLLAEVQTAPEETLRQLAKLGKAEVFYQLRGQSVELAMRERRSPNRPPDEAQGCPGASKR